MGPPETDSGGNRLETTGRLTGDRWEVDRSLWRTGRAPCPVAKMPEKGICQKKKRIALLCNIKLVISLIPFSLLNYKGSS